MQSHRMSIIESLVNTFGGFGIALWAQVTIFPWFGIHIPLASSAGIACIMLAISLVRQYAFRRLFNWFSRSKIDDEALSRCLMRYLREELQRSAPGTHVPSVGPYQEQVCHKPGTE